jgi:N-acetyl-anhydromuramyl-L-alanine amidase AmpD
MRWREARESSSRADAKVSCIVIHVEEGTEEGTAATFCSPQAHASAHFGIGKDGKIDQFVLESRCAWHAGNLAVNRTSIGIELEGFVADLGANFTPAMLSSLKGLIAYLADKYGLVLTRKTLIGHSEVPDPTDPTKFGGQNHHTDPGPSFPWADLMASLAGG